MTSNSWTAPTSLKACESFVTANMIGCLLLAVWWERKKCCGFAASVWLTKDALLTQLTIQQQITEPPPIVLPHFLHRRSRELTQRRCDRWRKCLLFLPHADKRSGGHCTSYQFLSRRQLWIFTKTLNIDCRVLTQNLNEIKTNINHTLALQQTLLGP